MKRRSFFGVVLGAAGCVAVDAPKVKAAVCPEPAVRNIFQIYRTGSGWRWRLRAGNGEILAQGEDYTSESGCRYAIGRIQASYGAPVIKTEQ